MFVIPFLKELGVKKCWNIDPSKNQLWNHFKQFSLYNNVLTSCHSFGIQHVKGVLPLFPL